MLVAAPIDIMKTLTIFSTVSAAMVYFDTVVVIGCYKLPCLLNLCSDAYIVPTLQFCASIILL
jgi:hypothetical protein